MCGMDKLGGALEIEDELVGDHKNNINIINYSMETSTSTSVTVGGGEEENYEERKKMRSDKSASSNFFTALPVKLPFNQVGKELMLLGKIACPVAITTLLIHSKSVISMLFLGHMGKSELAGGSLAIGFANVTGFSIMKGLCMGMEPICCQAYGAKRWSVLTQTYLKMFILLLFTSIPISLLWLNVEPVFQRLGQDRGITKVAKIYLVFSLPELLAHAHLSPLRSFLRTQGLNSPGTIVATCATILHLPINYFLVKYLNLGIKGIALASVWYMYNMNIGLLVYMLFSKVAIKPWGLGSTMLSSSMFQGWRQLLCLALPSVCSVCLEWWWYEIILFLSGLLPNPDSSVAAMGILIQTTGAIYVFPFSISLSISQRVGHELGAGQPARAQWAAVVGISLALCFGLTAFGLAIALRSVWGKMYTNEPEILHMVSMALPILGLAEVGNGPQTAACGVLTGSAQPKVGVRVNITAFYLVGLPAAVLMAFTFKIGFKGLWFGLVAAQGACAWMMVHTLINTDWTHQAKRAEELTLEDDTRNIDSVETNLVP